MPVLLLLLGLSTGRFGQKCFSGRCLLLFFRDKNLLVGLCFLKHIPFPLFLPCVIIFAFESHSIFFFPDSKFFFYFFLALGGLLPCFFPACR